MYICTWTIFPNRFTCFNKSSILLLKCKEMSVGLRIWTNVIWSLSLIINDNYYYRHKPLKKCSLIQSFAVLCSSFNLGPVWCGSCRGYADLISFTGSKRQSKQIHLVFDGITSYLFQTMWEYIKSRAEVLALKHLLSKTCSMLFYVTNYF